MCTMNDWVRVSIRASRWVSRQLDRWTNSNSRSDVASVLFPFLQYLLTKRLSLVFWASGSYGVVDFG